MSKIETRELIRMWIEEKNRKQRFLFTRLNPKGGHYTTVQKEYAINKAKSIGIRATSRLLHVPKKNHSKIMS